MAYDYMHRIVNGGGFRSWGIRSAVRRRSLGALGMDIRRIQGLLISMASMGGQYCPIVDEIDLRLGAARLNGGTVRQHGRLNPRP
jgi:hypothetical protein